MLEEISFKIIIVLLVVLAVYGLHVFATKRQNKRHIKDMVQNLESAEYDKDEWEKIKRELEKK